LWYSLTAAGHMQGEGDYASLHGACAPRSGEKVKIVLEKN